MVAIFHTLPFVLNAKTYYVDECLANRNLHLFQYKIVIVMNLGAYRAFHLLTWSKNYSINKCSKGKWPLNSNEWTSIVVFIAACARIVAGAPNSSILTAHEQSSNCSSRREKKQQILILANIHISYTCVWVSLSEKSTKMLLCISFSKFNCSRAPESLSNHRDLTEFRLYIIPSVR